VLHDESRQNCRGQLATYPGGALKPGAFLPLVRQRAIDLAVHFNPVAEAYRMLADEGWLDLKHHRGALLIARPTTLRVAPEVE
jgi:DNA-binding transcriptional regulator YhcF (GntR family)